MKIQLLTATVVALLSVSTNVSAGNDQARELGERYERAKTEDERLKICIEAINKKIICQNCSIRDLDAVFGTNFAKIDTSTLGGDGYLHEIVPFNTATIDALTPPPKDAKVNDAPSSIDIHGWFLGVRFSGSGRIVDYSITNVSKSF